MFRLLLFSVAFRIAFFAFLVFAIFLALFLPSIWQTTPPGFAPVIRVSGLSRVQAWSLKRGALQALVAGKTNDAIYAWQAAVAHDSANPELLRGLLQTLRLDTGGNQQMNLAIQHSYWLLRLTATNLADVELVSQVFERYRLTDFTLSLLEPLNRKMSPNLEKAYLKALFNAGQIKEFASRWPAVNPSAIDGEMRLYHAAYQAGWGTVNERLQGKESLDAALTNAQQRVLANRLSMTVGVQVGDVQRFEQSMRRLSEWGLDAPVDHCNYWRLLFASGQKTDALALAKAFRKPPGTGAEAIQLATTYSALGLADTAIDLLQRQTEEAAYDERLWIVWGDILVTNQRWEAASRLAARIRQQAAAQTTLLGYSHYLDGQAESGFGKAALAETAFQKAAASDYINPLIGLRVAEKICDQGHPGMAKELLLKLQPPLEKDPEYWKAILSVAEKQKDAELRLAAYAAAFQQQPNNVLAKNNYAAALITLRRLPAEAVKLTMNLVVQLPKSVAVKINHSQALLLNQRTDDAEAVLKTINPNRLAPEESASYYMAWFELYLNRQQYDLARQAANQIERRFLYSCESQWLDQAAAKLP
jgi:predicted Zn-dependent protease